MEGSLYTEKTLEVVYELRYRGQAFELPVPGPPEPDPGRLSENFARESWGSPAAAIGKRVRQFESTPWQEVIGVVQDARYRGADD